MWTKTEVMKEVFGFDKIERGLPHIVGQAAIFLEEIIYLQHEMAV